MREGHHLFIRNLVRILDTSCLIFAYVYDECILHSELSLYFNSSKDYPNERDNGPAPVSHLTNAIIFSPPYHGVDKDHVSATAEVHWTTIQLSRRKTKGSDSTKRRRVSMTPEVSIVMMPPSYFWEIVSRKKWGGLNFFQLCNCNCAYYSRSALDFEVQLAGNGISRTDDTKVVKTQKKLSIIC